MTNATPEREEEGGDAPLRRFIDPDFLDFYGQIELTRRDAVDRAAELPTYSAAAVLALLEHPPALEARPAPAAPPVATVREGEAQPPVVSTADEATSAVPSDTPPVSSVPAGAAAGADIAPGAPGVTAPVDPTGRDGAADAPAGAQVDEATAPEAPRIDDAPAPAGGQPPTRVNRLPPWAPAARATDEPFRKTSPSVAPSPLAPISEGVNAPPAEQDGADGALAAASHVEPDAAPPSADFLAPPAEAVALAVELDPEAPRPFHALVSDEFLATPGSTIPKERPSPVVDPDDFLDAPLVAPPGRDDSPGPVPAGPAVGPTPPSGPTAPLSPAAFLEAPVDSSEAQPVTRGAHEVAPAPDATPPGPVAPVRPEPWQEPRTAVNPLVSPVLAQTEPESGRTPLRPDETAGTDRPSFLAELVEQIELTQGADSGGLAAPAEHSGRLVEDRPSQSEPSSPGAVDSPVVGVPSAASAPPVFNLDEADDHPMPVAEGNWLVPPVAPEPGPNTDRPASEPGGDKAFYVEVPRGEKRADAPPVWDEFARVLDPSAPEIPSTSPAPPSNAPTIDLDSAEVRRASLERRSERERDDLPGIVFPPGPATLPQPPPARELPGIEFPPGPANLARPDPPKRLPGIVFPPGSVARVEDDRPSPPTIDLGLTPAPRFPSSPQPKVAPDAPRMPSGFQPNALANEDRIAPVSSAARASRPRAPRAARPAGPGRRRDRRPEILARLSAGPASAHELALEFEISREGVLRWLRQLEADGTIRSTAQARTSRVNKWVLVEPPGADDSSDG